jgi:DNA-binding NtrC family response regulator
VAKTIIAIMPTQADVRLSRQALAQHYKLWTCSSIPKSLELLKEGIRPQLIVSPFVKDTINSLFEHSDLQGIPVIIYAEPTDIATYQKDMKRAAAILHYPISEFLLLSTIDKFLRMKPY